MEADTLPRGIVPPGAYAGGARSPIVMVLLCPPCAGYAPMTDPDYRGFLSGRCRGCGSECREVHRFAALIDSAPGCRCTGEHDRVDGDLSAEETVAEGDRLFAALVAESKEARAMPDAPHPLAAELTAIGDRAEAMRNRDVWVRVAAAERDRDRLLGAVRAVAAFHVPHEVPSTRICAAHASGPKWRQSATLAEFRDEADACPDCVRTMQTVCAHCECPNDDWPCPTAQAITRVLLGKEGSDGG